MPLIQKKGLISKPGLILLSLVAAAAILAAITVADHRSFARETRAQWEQSYCSDQAFLIAESGVAVGHNWVGIAENLAKVRSDGKVAIGYDAGVLGFECSVTVEADPQNENGVVVVSRATDAGGVLPHWKEIELRLALAASADSTQQSSLTRVSWRERDVRR